MKRRTFLSSAGAAAVLPVMPLPALAPPPLATAPVRTAQVGWAALFARVNNRATPALIQKWLGVGAEQANALMSELIKQNVIHAPIAGSAAAVQPMHKASGIPGVSKTTAKLLETSRDILDAVINEDEVEAAPEASPKEATDEAS